MFAGDNHVFERISNEYYRLTEAERKVADYAVIHRRDTQFLSISELACACGVAEATVSRFCRRLNYKGFSAFKLALANAEAHRREDPVAGVQVQPEDSIPTVAQKCLSAEWEALAQTLSLIRPEEVSAAAELLATADRVLCMGQGSGMLMAQEAAHLFSTIRPGVWPVGDTHLQAISAAGLTERDAVLFFSYSGSTREAVELLPAARERGAQIILMTRFPKSPAAAYAHVILRCGASELPLRRGAVSAQMVQMYLLDVLFAEMLRKHEDVCARHLERVDAALAGKHV